MENEDEGYGERSHERKRFGGRGNSDRSSAPREMHTVTCSECKQETQVPFKPDGTRPVYCRDCYAKRKPKREY